MKKEVSMKPTEKRNVLVKQMLRPLLKSRGFQSSGNTWWRELKDGWLIIHMQNSRWNGSATGANFNFQISVSSKNEIVDKLKNQWRHNLINDLCGTDFLPYCGYLSPHMTPFGYQIDGYRNGMPSDDPLDEFIEQVRGDFETYILPALNQVRTIADWNDLYQEIHVRYDEPDVRLLRYYSSVQRCSFTANNIPHLVKLQEEFGLTPEMITSHFDWLEIIRQNAHSYDDAKPFILKMLGI